MRLVIATRNLAGPGGSETFVLTLAEAFSQLGHQVTVLAVRLGMVAEEATRRALTVISESEKLSTSADATIALDRSLAIELAKRYPAATRMFAMHNALEEWLPPPEPGIVHATLAPNTFFEKLARGCVGAGRAVRINQPIDIVRFSPRGFAKATPSDVLLCGNYLHTEGQRAAQLKSAWKHAELHWHQLGHPTPSLNVAETISAADIVVGYGRSILEAMACGRPAYVHEHSGSDGWVTADSYQALEAHGFAGGALRSHPDEQELRADLARYSPELGRVGQDLVRRHHDSKLVAAAIIDQVSTPVGKTFLYDPQALQGLQQLTDSLMRAEHKAEAYRMELKGLAGHLQLHKEELEKMRAKRSRKRFGALRKLKRAVAERLRLGSREKL